MFDIGFQEITLIGVIALIVVGPERLPKMARTLGLWMGKIRFYVNQVKSDIDREVRAQDLKEMLNKPARDLEDVYKVAEETKGALGDAKSALGDAKSALGDAKSALGDAKSVLGDSKSSIDGTTTDASTPGEPAAGSIFPPVPPAVHEESAEESATADSASDEPPASTGAAEPDEPEGARDGSDNHETTAAATAAGKDDERTSGTV